MTYEERRQSLNEKLGDRVQKEYESFCEEIKKKSPQEIFDAAYQIVFKTDIAECFSETDYSSNTVRAMMKSPNILEDVYQEWLSNDYSYMEDLRQTIDDFKDYMVKTEKMISGKER
ncbi:MAG: DUF3848 domain-containing protein [Clostridiales bacterium]|nr:DUF3848 domain-containing protein [Clostridiales bacterium]